MDKKLGKYSSEKNINQNFQIFFANPHLLEICSIGRTNLQVFWAVPNLIFHQVTLLQSKASRKMLHKKGVLPSQDAVPQVIFTLPRNELLCQLFERLR